MPISTFQHSAIAAASPDAIWVALQDAATWGGIGPIEKAWDAEHGEDGSLQSYKWSANAAGRTWKGTARTTAAVAGESMEMAITTKEIRGIVTITLTPEGESTDVAVRLQAEPAGMMATLFWRAVKDTIASGFNRQVEEFAWRLAG
jgi:carbon monoxide dehydrogenase subunit G